MLNKFENGRNANYSSIRIDWFRGHPISNGFVIFSNRGLVGIERERKESEKESKTLPTHLIPSSLEKEHERRSSLFLFLPSLETPVFFPPREDRLLGGGPDIFHPRSGGNWWKLVQREPQYGDPYAVTREREREFPREKNLPWRRPISISRCWLQPWSPCSS